MISDYKIALYTRQPWIKFSRNFSLKSNPTTNKPKMHALVHSPQLSSSSSTSSFMPFKSIKTLASSNNCTFLSSKLLLLQTSISTSSHPTKPTSLHALHLSQQVDYNSMLTSVFPAEACETIGGEACDAVMYPEVKLQVEPTSKNASTSDTENVDREYLDYNNPKTVFPAEACDDLGGEFCEPAYQSGVF